MSLSLALLACGWLWASGPVPQSEDGRAGQARLSRDSGVDGLKRLELDPSPDASRRLMELYHKTKSRDQRFWLVQTLGSRLKELGDERALKALLVAASDPDSSVRGPALAALAGFPSLPAEVVRDKWLGRIEAVAVQGAKYKTQEVRQGAEQLRRALDDWRRAPPLRPRQEGVGAGDQSARVGLRARLARGGPWLWLLVLPLLGLGWAGMGLPIFDARGREGQIAHSLWRALQRRPIHLGVCALAWLFLAAMLTSLGFDALVLLAGDPLYEPDADWLQGYIAAGFCLFLPGAVLAALTAGEGEEAGLGSVGVLPWGIAMALAVLLFLAPLESLYRLFLRRAKRAQAGEAPGGTLAWILETGSLRASYLALAVVASQGHGLLPAFERARELSGDGEKQPAPRLGLACFDPRFALLCAAPALAFFCVMIARGEPVVWRVSLPVLLVGCTLWAWGVLAGILFAVAQALEGFQAGERLRLDQGDRASFQEARGGDNGA